MSGFDTFPYLKAALDLANVDNNCLIVASSEVSAWLFTCILQKALGRSTPPPARGIKGYEIVIDPYKPGPVCGSVTLLSNASAKKMIGRSDRFNISYVWDEDGDRMSLEDWQEKAGLIRRRPASRFERLEMDADVQTRGRRLDEFPKRSWIEVERRGYKRKVVVQIVNWPTSWDYKLCRDARGREFRIYYRDVLSAVRVPRPKKVVQ